MGTALAAITRACTALGFDRSHPLIESLLRLDEASGGGGGSAPPVFYATSAASFPIPARAPLIVVSANASVGNVDVVLPANPQPGDVVRIKSVAVRGIGNVSLSSVADTIDGSASWPTGPIIVGTKYSCVNVMFQPNGVGGVAEWSVVSDYGGTRGGPGP
jgi:hypothetical protein